MKRLAWILQHEITTFQLKFYEGSLKCQLTKIKLNAFLNDYNGVTFYSPQNTSVYIYVYIFK